MKNPRPGLTGTSTRSSGGYLAPDAQTLTGREPDSFREEGFARHALALGGATLLARGSGYVRTLALASIVGVGSLANAFGTANAFPNMMFELLMGGSLRSVLVPAAVQEFARSDEQGWRLVSALGNIAALFLAAVTALAVLASPWIFRALTLGLQRSDAGQLRFVGSVLLALMVPQVIFYGLDLVATGALNAHRRFALPTLAVVVGNVVAVGALVLFGFVRGASTSLSLKGSEFALLGGGMTVAVAVIAVLEIAALRRMGGRYYLTLGRGNEAVRRALLAGGWMFIYVVANQVGLWVVLILANRVEGGVAAYQYAYTFFMLPYGVAGLALASTLLPQASTLAAMDDRTGVARVISEAMGLALLVLLPASVVLAVWGQPIAQLLLGYGAAKGAGATFVGQVLSMFALGLVPFAMFQLLTRASYAFHKTKIPALVNVLGVGVNIAADLVVFVVLEGRQRIAGLAGGHALSYLVAALLLWIITSRQLGTTIMPRLRLQAWASGHGQT